eukprot:TRINITY_DN24607_c0_g1_i1.p1 TRINITY_DN24607_c0_g1~~TRINITY_DN24607_c0_g1_i1.p1  ORF type:complete len:107 (-),score=18.52 TRINITY_DN24607_c0_g1_i1:101-421(-)
MQRRERTLAFCALASCFLLAAQRDASGDWLASCLSSNAGAEAWQEALAGSVHHTPDAGRARPVRLAQRGLNAKQKRALRLSGKSWTSAVSGALFVPEVEQDPKSDP